MIPTEATIDFRGDSRFVAFSDIFTPPPPLRVLVFADRHGATQEISFLRALQRWRVAETAAIRIIDEPGLATLRKGGGSYAVHAFLERQFSACRPSVVILSRFCGPEYSLIYQLSRECAAPVICHLDDNLLDPPSSLGIDIWGRLKHPRRLHALYEIIQQADLVYTSTSRLAKAVQERCSVNHLFAGQIYVGADANAAVDHLTLDSVSDKRDEEIRIGYMGSASHSFDFELVAEAVRDVMSKFSNVTFHMFGSIASTPIAKSFTENALLLSRVDGDYIDFRAALRLLRWDIGLAPLRATEFNECKASTKCIEYLEAGIAPIATDCEVYRAFGKEGAALLASSNNWADAIQKLVLDSTYRQEIVHAGRKLLMREFTWERLERQVIDVFAMVVSER